jgi:hypothetical protein
VTSSELTKKQSEKKPQYVRQKYKTDKKNIRTAVQNRWDKEKVIKKVYAQNNTLVTAAENNEDTTWMMSLETPN